MPPRINTHFKEAEPRRLSKMARGLFGILPSIFTTALIIDTYQGQKENRSIGVNQNIINADLHVMMERQNQWSGYPWLDKQSERLKDLSTYGPWNLRQRWQNFKIRANNLIWQVLYPNTNFILISIASLYLSFGRKRVHAPFKALGRGFSKTSISPVFKRQLSRAASATGQGIATGLGAIISVPFRSFYHLGASILLGVMGLFFLDRFQQVYGDEAQEEFFRPGIWDEEQ
jgi:hypothetical protein